MKLGAGARGDFEVFEALEVFLLERDSHSTEKLVTRTSGSLIRRESSEPCFYLRKNRMFDMTHDIIAKLLISFVLDPNRTTSRLYPRASHKLLERRED